MIKYLQIVIIMAKEYDIHVFATPTQTLYVVRRILQIQDYFHMLQTDTITVNLDSTSEGNTSAKYVTASGVMSL